MLSFSADTNTSGASETKHLYYHKLQSINACFGDETHGAELTENMKHKGGIALIYLVGGSANIHPIVGRGHRPDD